MMQMVARMMAADDNKKRQITSTAVCAAVGGCTGTGFPVLGITASAQLTDVNSIWSEQERQKSAPAFSQTAIVTELS